MKFLTISQIHNLFKRREISVSELTKYYLEKIKKEDKEIGAFLTVCENLAISQAQKLDKELLKLQKLPPLFGIPCAIKDNILVKNLKCTAGSKILQNYIAPYDATVIRKLKEAGAIILGKTNMDEFAMGSSNEYSAFFTTKNPLDKEKVPGGSSGGSAAAIAADFCVFALGSDTGGSVRQPAAFCQIVGFRPTYGAISRFGLIAFSSSLDQIGPMAKTIEDVKIVFDVIRGKDQFDSTSLDVLDEENLDIKNLKIGIPKEYFTETLDAQIKADILFAINKYEKMGAKIEEISLPHTEYALPCYYIIATAEASSNLARFDGIKYGLSKDGKDLFEVYSLTRDLGLGPEVKRRIMLGTFVLSRGYFEEYYVRAQKVRTLIKRDFMEAFKKVDVILTPTSPFFPFKFGERTKDPLAMYLADIYTISAPLASLPAISFPAIKREKFSGSVQLIGKPMEDKKLIKIASFYDSQ